MQELDNRDLTETWIQTHVEVNPFDLFANAITNAHPQLATLMALAIDRLPTWDELTENQAQHIRDDSDLRSLYNEVQKRLYQALMEQ